ncbi:MAG: hypothetical protein Q4P20_06215 [Eubacteriales bacterium]|nr:hypothetical protein [Eubacteriales bacterium]
MIHRSGKLTDIINELISSDKISAKAIADLIHISPEQLDQYRSGNTGSVPPAERSALFHLCMILGPGLEVDDDEKVTALLHDIIQEYHITLEQLSRLISVELSALEQLQNGEPVDPQTKYHATVRIFYVYYGLHGCNNAAESAQRAMEEAARDIGK